MAFVIYLGYDRFKYKWAYALFILSLSIATYKMPILPPWSIDISLIAFIFMLIGNKLRALFFDSMLSTKQLLIVVASAILFYIVATYNGFVCVIFRNYDTQGYLSIPLLLIEGTLIISRLCQWLEGSMLIKAFAYVGRQSLRLLCIHMPIYVYTNAIVLKLPYLCDLSEGLLAPFYFVEMLLINALLDCLIQKYQMKFRYLKYI